MDNDEATSRASTVDSEPVPPEPDISEDIDEEEDVPAVISRHTAMAHVDSLVAFGLSRVWLNLVHWTPLSYVAHVI